MKTSFAVALTAMAVAVQAQSGNFRPYSVSTDFHEVANAKTLAKFVTLSPEHKALLKRNLFVVSPRGDEQLYYIYGVNDYQNLPSLITTDSVLHLYHVFFDATLRKIEQDALLPKLKRMTAKLIEASKQQAASAANPLMKAAADKNVAYFTVAENLIQAGLASPNPMADSELEQIKAQSGFKKSAIFPYEVDYSRFIVRGHYTKTEALKHYFQAMTWYGMMPFALADKSGKPAPEQIRMAVLAADALYSSKETDDWNAIYKPTSLYVGASNMFTPAEIREVATSVFGSPKTVDSSKLGAFVSAVRAIRTPKIQARKRGDQPGAEVQFRFMGLRYIPDSEMLQRLTGQERPMPSGLDIMSVLGSRRASEILDSNQSRYNPRPWAGYLPERAKLTSQFAQVASSTWSSNLYWGWLDTLRLFLKPAPAGYPQFMRNQAWQDKNLSTALASWAELRHDTILYGEQSVSEMGDGDEPQPFVKGFVEPNLPVYQRLLALSKQSRVELQRLRLINQEGLDQLLAYESLLSFCASCSRKELAGIKLTKAEHLRIRHIEADYSDMTETMLKYGTNFKALTEDDKNMALIADVHTGGGNALEEGVGKADELIAVVPIEGKLYFARGCVFSYYEFQVPIAQRMSDEAWKKKLEDGSAPHRPHWTSSFFTANKAKEKD